MGPERGIMKSKYDKYLTHIEETIDIGGCCFANGPIDIWSTTNRIFVAHLPWWQRFLIWLFPRMYDIRDYNES